MIINGRKCYCGSGRLYDDCCGPLLSGRRSAAAAEELMRSRYTANVLRDTAYLLQSWHPSTRPDALDPRVIPTWQGLTVLKTEQGLPGDREGMVEFKALHKKNTGTAVLQERSRFIYENGCWYYVDGVLIAPAPGKCGKTGRNAPCPCGSGKKYKKCCLSRKESTER